MSQRSASGGITVVVPVKAFTAAKQRLRDHLAADDRSRLARHLADGVARRITTAEGVDLVVACDDPDVRRWAEATGATVAWTPGLGLNGAIDAGVDHAIESGASTIVVAHADLVRPAALEHVWRSPDTITVVPDRHRDGTNAMAFPATARLRAEYGPGSYGRHLRQAMEVGAATEVPVRVRPDADLGLDVDTIADVLHPSIRSELPAWLRIHQDNRSTPVG